MISGAMNLSKLPDVARYSRVVRTTGRIDTSACCLIDASDAKYSQPVCLRTFADSLVVLREKIVLTHAFLRQTCLLLAHQLEPNKFHSIRAKNGLHCYKRVPTNTPQVKSTLKTVQAFSGWALGAEESQQKPQQTTSPPSRPQPWWQEAYSIP